MKIYGTIGNLNQSKLFLNLFVFEDKNGTEFFIETDPIEWKENGHVFDFRIKTEDLIIESETQVDLSIPDEINLRDLTLVGIHVVINDPNISSNEETIKIGRLKLRRLVFYTKGIDSDTMTIHPRLNKVKFYRSEL